MSEKWKILFVVESDGSHTCKRCEASLATATLAEQHWFDCTAGRFKKFKMWFSARFVEKNGFDREKTSTKILEFVYLRYLEDWFAIRITLFLVLLRLHLMYGFHEGIPYSGMYPPTTIEVFYFLYFLYNFGEACVGVREYKVKVIKEIPNLQKELGTIKTS